MPSYGTTRNYYSTGHWMTTCGSDAGATAGEVLEFGFAARGLRIYNSCADSLFFSLTTENDASTGSAFLAGSGGEFLIHDSLWTSGLSLKTTSTSTGAGLPAARPWVSIVAWSG